MGMGLIGAIGGIGEGIAGMAQQNMQNEAKLSMDQELEGIKEARSRREAQFKQDLADQARRDQVDRIGAAQQAIVQQGIGSKYAGSDAAVADADAGNTVAPLTDEQRAAIAQSKENDARTLANDPKMYVQAGMQTGDIAPKDVLAANVKTDKTATWQDVAMAKMLSNERNTDVRAGATTEAAEIHADGATERAVMRSQDGGLTNAQRVRNAEINFARQKIAGLSQDEIKSRTQQFTSTGRENKDYDPQLATRAKKAYQRKYGDDSWFDGQMSGSEAGPIESPASKPATASDRFAADPSMKGMRLGMSTALGMEVVDANGKLIGHYK